MDPRTAVFISHSAGKDSQITQIELEKIIPKERIFVIHADLGDKCEWAGVQTHIHNTVSPGIPIHITKARTREGKTNRFFDLVDRRLELHPDQPPWPSSSCRQCTSDLKRGPIRRTIRKIMSEHPEFDTIVDVMGLRAQESGPRAKKKTWQVMNSLCTKTRMFMRLKHPEDTIAKVIAEKNERLERLRSISNEIREVIGVSAEYHLTERRIIAAIDMPMRSYQRIAYNPHRSDPVEQRLFPGLLDICARHHLIVARYWTNGKMYIEFSHA